MLPQSHAISHLRASPLISESRPLGQPVDPRRLSGGRGLDAPLSGAATDSSRAANATDLSSIASDILPDAEHDAGAAELGVAVRSKDFIDDNEAGLVVLADLDLHGDAVLDTVVEGRGLVHVRRGVGEGDESLALVVPLRRGLQVVETDRDILASQVDNVSGVGAEARNEAPRDCHSRDTRVAGSSNTAWGGPEAATSIGVDSALGNVESTTDTHPPEA